MVRTSEYSCHTPNVAVKSLLFDDPAIILKFSGVPRFGSTLLNRNLNPISRVDAVNALLSLTYGLVSEEALVVNNATPPVLLVFEKPFPDIES